jgi:hypothetical protein
LPWDFRFRDRGELFVPVGQWDDAQLRDRRFHMGFRAMARLKPGVTLAAAEAEMNGIARQLAELYPDSNGEHGVRLTPMKQDIVFHRRDVLGLVVREGMALTVSGTGLGIIAALGLTRLLASLLYGVRPTDACTLLAVSLLLGGVALLACYIPAWRATKVDTMVALRYE